MIEQKIKIKLLHPDAQIPIRFNETDACYDVFATSRNICGDGRIIYGLGFSMELPPNTQLDCRPRSSIHKTGLILSNSIGTIDEDYRGELKAVFYHVLPNLPPYEIGDRILQIQLRSREDVEFVRVYELTDTERGDGGYGSTGR
jgi:dUTP pyrophosphatase